MAIFAIVDVDHFQQRYAFTYLELILELEDIWKWFPTKFLKVSFKLINYPFTVYCFEGTGDKKRASCILKLLFFWS